MSSTRTVPVVQREGPPKAEEEPPLLQRPERAHTVQELEELAKEGCFQNEEVPRPGREGQQTERNPNTQPGVPKEKKRKEQMIDLQNLLTTKSPSVKSLAIPTTVEELVSRAGGMGHCGGSELVQKVSFLHEEENQ